jgi:hypothetical protein
MKKPDLEKLHCDGCGHHCPLSKPRCKKGKKKREKVLADWEKKQEKKAKKKDADGKHEDKSSSSGKKTDKKHRSKKADKHGYSSKNLEAALQSLSDKERETLFALLQKMTKESGRKSE